MRSVAQSAQRLWRNAERSRAILPIMASVLLACTGSAMLTTAVSLRLGEPDVTANVVQLVLTAYPAGFLAGCLLTRPMVSRFGHERTFALILALTLVATSGFALTGSLPAWIGLRFFVGLAMASMFVVCESWINLYAEQHNRGVLFSLYMLTTGSSVLVGQLLVGLVGPHSPYLFSVAAATVLASLLAKFAAGPWPVLPADPHPAGTIPSEERLSVLRLFQLAPVTFVSIFQAGITNVNIFVLTPIYGTQIGLTAETTVGLVTTVSIAGMLAQTPVGWLSDRYDRRLLLLVLGVLSLTLCVTIAWVGNSSPLLLFVLFFIYGATALTIYPVAIAFANSQLPSRHMVAASGTLLSLYSIGNVATPGIAAGLMASIAPQAMFLLLGGGAVLVTVAACYNLLRQPGPVFANPVREEAEERV